MLERSHGPNDGKLDMQQITDHVNGNRVHGKFQLSLRKKMQEQAFGQLPQDIFNDVSQHASAGLHARDTVLSENESNDASSSS